MDLPYCQRSAHIPRRQALSNRYHITSPGSSVLSVAIEGCVTRVLLAVCQKKGLLNSLVPTERARTHMKRTPWISYRQGKLPRTILQRTGTPSLALSGSSVRLY